MEVSSKMEVLTELETEMVSGGTSLPPIDVGDTEYWQDQLLRYKTGLSSVFD